MNYYEIWFDLAPGEKDMVVVEAIRRWLDYFKDRGTLESYIITRCKFGFRPTGMPEFHVTIKFRDLAQLDAAFMRAATRDAEVEPLHADVYSRITNYQSGLFREFPDAVRVR